jgi:hypothetical protein
LQGLIDQAYDQILKLLTTEWLVADVETGGGTLSVRCLPANNAH